MAYWSINETVIEEMSRKRTETSKVMVKHLARRNQSGDIVETRLRCMDGTTLAIAKVKLIRRSKKAEKAYKKTGGILVPTLLEMWETEVIERLGIKNGMNTKVEFISTRLGEDIETSTSTIHEWHWKHRVKRPRRRTKYQR